MYMLDGTWITMVALSSGRFMRDLSALPPGLHDMLPKAVFTLLFRNSDPT